MALFACELRISTATLKLPQIRVTLLNFKLGLFIDKLLRV